MENFAFYFGQISTRKLDLKEGGQVEGWIELVERDNLNLIKGKTKTLEHF